MKLKYSAKKCDTSSDMSKHPHPTLQERVQRAIEAGRRTRERIERERRRAAEVPA